MNTQAVDADERDLIDRVADALPAGVRAEFYRELRHCRSLPENDEMLRILRAMQFLTLLIHEAPARMAAEREQIDRNLAGCLAALTAIERRLDALPEGVASSIGPEKVAARINECLRQQFVQSTIPQTGETLGELAGGMRRSVAAFVEAAREISGSHRGTAVEARTAIRDIEGAIEGASRASRAATAELGRTVQYLSWSSLAFGALGVFVAGAAVGVFISR
ncbi:MAG: hypothetical protein R2729_23380 [Bryobacteraceae bacterium]